MRGFRKIPLSDSRPPKELRELINRILASSVFERSARLRDFLRYICDCALDGHPEEVHEQLIGHRVFNRPIDYNLADENIVRVSARQLRTKLHEYFETDGRDERWFVEIPKGGYLPAFCERELQDYPAHRANTGAQLHPTSSTNFITGLFGLSPDPLGIVVSDSALVLMQALARRRFSLEEYAGRSYRSFPREISEYADLRSFWDFLCTRQLSNIGDMKAANQILMSVTASGVKVVVRNTRNVSARDFMTGNFVLLGSPYSNPWAQLFFERHLNFQFAGEELGGESEIRNRQAYPGEKKLYSSRGRLAKGGLSYAHIALVPNLTDSGRILLVGGISMEATEAAANFLLSSTSTQKVLDILEKPQAMPLPDFELLLETSALEGTPKSVRVIAHRTYPEHP